MRIITTISIVGTGQVKNWPLRKSGDTESAIEQLAKKHNNTILGVFREPVAKSPMFEEFRVLALLLSLPGQSTVSLDNLNFVRQSLAYEV